MLSIYRPPADDRRRADDRNRRSNVGAISAMNTKTAVTSLRSLGAHECFAYDHAREADHDDTDPHLHVCEALVLGDQGAAQGDQAIRQGKPENGERLHAHAQGTHHLRIVAGGAHGRAELRSIKPVENQADGNHDDKAADQDRKVPNPDRPAEHVHTGAPAGQRIPDGSPIRGQRRLVDEGDIAAPHDSQIDRVKGRHRQYPGEQWLNATLRRHQARARARDKPGQSCNERGQRRIDALDDQRGRNRGAERNRALRSDVRYVQDPETHVYAEGEHREDKPQGESSDKKIHGSAPL
jgi:hypothetical protein